MLPFAVVGQNYPQLQMFDGCCCHFFLHPFWASDLGSCQNAQRCNENRYKPGLFCDLFQFLFDIFGGPRSSMLGIFCSRALLSLRIGSQMLQVKPSSLSRIILPFKALPLLSVVLFYLDSIYLSIISVMLFCFFIA